MIIKNSICQISLVALKENYLFPNQVINWELLHFCSTNAIAIATDTYNKHQLK